MGVLLFVENKAFFNQSKMILSQGYNSGLVHTLIFTKNIRKMEHHINVKILYALVKLEFSNKQQIRLGELLFESTLSDKPLSPIKNEP